MEENTSGYQDSREENTNPDKGGESKKSLIQFFGYEISAPTGMNNPVLKLLGLIFLNIILLLSLKSLLR